MFMLMGVLHLSAATASGDARPTNPGFGPETIEVLPYRSPGYRYKVIGSNDLPTRGFEKPGFDDSSWQVGDSAFGSGGVFCPDKTKLLCTQPDCPLQHTVRTYWRPDSKLLVRKTFQVPAGARNVRVLIAVDDDIVGMFFNGKPLPGYHFHKGCPRLDEFRFDVPQGLVRNGANMIALQLRDRGGSSFFDVSVLAERPLTTATVPVCTVEQMRSWKFINDQQQGVAGKDRVGSRIGGFPAERLFFDVDTWYPADGYKHTLCGRLHHFNFYNSFISNEDDWNNFFKPRQSHQFLLFSPLFARLKWGAQCRKKIPESAWRLCPGIDSWHRCDGIPVSPEGTLPDCMEAELEPNGSFMENPWFPRSINASPLEGCDLCAYGAWVQDCWKFPDNHDCRPEIHPSELIWWKAAPQGTCVVPFQSNVSSAVASGKVDVHYLMVLNDSSDRFDDTGDFDGFSSAYYLSPAFPIVYFSPAPPLWWRPWASDPRTVEFRYAFQIIGPASTVTPLRLSVQQLSARKVVTGQDPLQRRRDPDTQAVQELRYNGIPLVRVTERKEVDGNVSVGFAEICRNAADTRLQGYVSVGTSVGEGGHHVLAIVSQGQVLDLSPPEKPRGHFVEWLADTDSTRFSREHGTVVSNLYFKVTPRGGGTKPGTGASVESVFRLEDDERRPVRFEAAKEPGRFKAFDIPVQDDLRLVVKMDSGTSLEAALPGLVFVPFAGRDEVGYYRPEPAGASTWAAIAEASGGLPTAGLDPPLRVAKVRRWGFEAVPYYTPRRYGESAPEDESPVSGELNRAILNGSAEELERLFGTAEPFVFRWDFRAIDAVTGERVPVVRDEVGTYDAIVVTTRDGHFPRSVIRVSFPETGALIRLFAVASVTDTLGNRSEVVKVVWNHVLSAESPQYLSQGILPTLARLAGLSVEEFIEATVPREVGEDEGFVDPWVTDPPLAAARMARTAAYQSAFDSMITPDELARLIGTAQLFAIPVTPDADDDGVADFIDLCPGKDDLLDSDGDGYPDCLDDQQP